MATTPKSPITLAPVTIAKPVVAQAPVAPVAKPASLVAAPAKPVAIAAAKPVAIAAAKPVAIAAPKPVLAKPVAPAKPVAAKPVAAKPVAAKTVAAKTVTDTPVLAKIVAPIVPAAKPMLTSGLPVPPVVIEAQEAFRKVAEQSIDASKVNLGKAKVVADEAKTSLELSMTTASKGISELNARTFSALRANTEAQFELFKALGNVKTIADAMTLQSEFTKKQFADMQNQTRDLLALAQKVAKETVQPLSETLKKSFNVAL